MQINSLTLSQPLQWFKIGWSIFKNNPLQWILILIVFFICLVILNIIPMIGSFIYILISPALFAGLFVATEKSANAEKIAVGDLFSVLLDANQRNKFLMLGGLTFLFDLLIMGVLLLPMMGAAGVSHMSGSGDETMAFAMMGAGMGSLLIILPLIILYVMAMVYAIPLILFAKQGIKDALLLSLKASVSNILPMFVASIIYLLLAFAAMIPIGLGFFILFPMTFGAIYASYKDIFS